MPPFDEGTAWKKVQKADGSTHSNEHWEFDGNSLMQRRDASISDYEVGESERKFRWEYPEEL